MKLLCSADHGPRPGRVTTTHDFTAGEVERIVYVLQARVGVGERRSEAGIVKPAVTIERRDTHYRVLVTVRDRAVKLWSERNVDAALDHFCREYRWAATKAERRAS